MADKKKKCFVIMPISTPDSHLSEYRGDKEHFKHVLEHLFAPAIKSIDYELIPPNARGADVIHAEIIKNLEEADLVLCDMSTFNPNVFFELGIRTALNKPVCIVKDDKTPEIPFDIGIVNSHTYLNGLDAWTLENDIKKIKEHIEESIKRSGSENMLWRQFGITSVAKEYKQEAGVDPRIEYVMIQLDSIKQELENQKVDRYQRKGVLPRLTTEEARQQLDKMIIDDFQRVLDSNKIKAKYIALTEDGTITINLRGIKITPTISNQLFEIADLYKLKLVISETN